LTIRFTKYQATGNDFILIDNRSGEIKLSKEQIVRTCDRKFGIGADGLILIEPSPSSDFTVNYYNSDGSQSLCGNGSRAAVHFAAQLSLLKDKTVFDAYDGKHEASLITPEIIRLRMNDVSSIQPHDNDVFLHTGSPHFIRFVKEISNYPVYEEGKSIRYGDDFKPDGTNVNFVELLPANTIFVRTYERGVENETLSCGTGVTAAALAASRKGYTSPISIKTLGGELSVEFKTRQAGLPAEEAGAFTDIFLIGPAKKVFEGTLEL
jgi:diaminopimelate epimerase